MAKLGPRRKSILVTGATGLVGFEIIDQLRRYSHLNVVGTSRRGSTGVSGVIRWDMAEQSPPPALQQEWDVVVNTAADIRWLLSPADAFRANVGTLRALRSLVRPRTHLIHFSTAYSGGHHGSTASEDVQDYRNSYEWSKAAAERYAKKSFDRLTIIRPPLLIGRSLDGRAARFSGLFVIVRGIATGSVPAISGDCDARLDVVCVDQVAKRVVVQVLNDSTDERPEVTLACGTYAPTVGSLVRGMTMALNNWRAPRCLPQIQTPRIIPPSSWHRFFLPFARSELSVRQNRLIDLLQAFEPYVTATIPLSPTHIIKWCDGYLDTAVAYWADTHSRLAGTNALAWRRE